MADTTHGHESLVKDPCAEFGPVQIKALLWFFGAVLLGGTLVANFARIDAWMWDTNAEFFNYNAYRENRKSATSLAGDSIDERAHGGIDAARHMIAEDSK